MKLKLFLIANPYASTMDELQGSPIDTEWIPSHGSFIHLREKRYRVEDVNLSVEKHGKLVYPWVTVTDATGD